MTSLPPAAEHNPRVEQGTQRLVDGDPERCPPVRFEPDERLQRVGALIGNWIAVKVYGSLERQR